MIFFLFQLIGITFARQLKAVMSGRAVGIKKEALHILTKPSLTGLLTAKSLKPSGLCLIISLSNF